MITEVHHNIFMIEVPLPDTPLKVINSYFIRGTERNLLIDTGFRCEISHQAFRKAMDRIPFSMDNTDIFVTHSHSDHCGLTSTLISPESIVYCSPYVAESLRGRDGDDWENYLHIASESGLPQMEMEAHPGYLYATNPVDKVVEVEDGQVIQVGEYQLTCVETSGHAPGHMCLFDAEKKILFSGDHILAGITPNNTIWDRPWGIQRDLLGEYLSNLEKIRQLQPQIVFPGHRAIITDAETRIQELIEHHEIRLDAVRRILAEEPHLHGAQVASRMQWQIRAKNWEAFPTAQKLFATGEAMSHLTHLLFRGELTATFEEGVVYYCLATGKSVEN